MTLPVRERRRRAAVAKKVGRKVGRPRKIIPDYSVEKLAEIQCTNKEIAAILGVSGKVFQERLNQEPELREALDRGRERGKVNLRQLQFRHAEGEGGPATNMAIHLGKHILGQTDRPAETKSTIDVNVTVTDSRERLANKFDDLRQRLLGAPAIVDAEYSEVTPDAESERIER